MQRYAAFLLAGTVSLQVGGAEDSFGQPKRLCSALVSEGLKTEGWKPSRAIPGEWSCMTTLVPIGAVGSNGLANNIAFYVTGTSSSRANDIRIKININNPTERDRAFSRLSSATNVMFKAISRPVPLELMQALSQRKPAAITAPFGKAELILEPGAIDSFKVVLSDARFLSLTEQSRSNSAGDFAQCKNVVGKAVGYSATLLSGTGKPSQESGYQSFMLEGRGEDLFFCEVHSGGRYKIKAAFGGKFPFKYIAEGSF